MQTRCYLINLLLLLCLLLVFFTGPCSSKRGGGGGGSRGGGSRGGSSSGGSRGSSSSSGSNRIFSSSSSSSSSRSSGSWFSSSRTRVPATRARVYTPYYSRPMVPMIAPRVPYMRPRPVIFWSPYYYPGFYYHHHHYYSNNRVFYKTPRSEVNELTPENARLETAFFGCTPDSLVPSADGGYWCSSVFNASMILASGTTSSSFSDSSDDKEESIDIFLFTLSEKGNYRMLLYGLTPSDYQSRLSGIGGNTADNPEGRGTLLYDSETVCTTAWNWTTPCPMPLLTTWRKYAAFEIVARGNEATTCLSNYWFRLSWFTDDFFSVFSNGTFDDKIERQLQCPKPALAYSGTAENPQMYLCIYDLADDVNNTCPDVDVDPYMRRRFQFESEESEFDTATLVNIIIVVSFILVVGCAIYGKFRYSIHLWCRQRCGRQPPIVVASSVPLLPQNPGYPTMPVGPPVGQPGYPPTAPPPGAPGYPTGFPGPAGYPQAPYPGQMPPPGGAPYAGPYPQMQGGNVGYSFAPMPPGGYQYPPSQPGATDQPPPSSNALPYPLAPTGAAPVAPFGSPPSYEDSVKK